MERGAPRRFDYGVETWVELCWLLLVADAALFRVGCHEHGVDGYCDRFYVGREGISQESVGKSNQRCDPYRVGPLGHCRSHALAKINKIAPLAETKEMANPN